ncbi:MAG: hypothetical protein ABSD75_06820 [Terriglobales bacterium]
MIAGGQRRESTAVTQADNEHTIKINEVVFRHSIEGGPPASHFAFEVCLGTIALAFTHSGLVHAHGSVSGLVNETAEENAETVTGVRIRVFHAVAAQPADEEYCWHFAGGVVGARNKSTELLTAGVGNPVLEDRAVIEVFAGLSGLRYDGDG